MRIRKMKTFDLVFPPTRWLIGILGVGSLIVTIWVVSSSFKKQNDELAEYKRDFLNGETEIQQLNDIVWKVDRELLSLMSATGVDVVNQFKWTNLLSRKYVRELDCSEVLFTSDSRTPEEVLMPSGDTGNLKLNLTANRIKYAEHNHACYLQLSCAHFQEHERISPMFSPNVNVDAQWAEYKVSGRAPNLPSSFPYEMRYKPIPHSCKTPLSPYYWRFAGLIDLLRMDIQSEASTILGGLPTQLSFVREEDLELDFSMDTAIYVDSDVAFSNFAWNIWTNLKSVDGISKSPGSLIVGTDYLCFTENPLVDGQIQNFTSLLNTGVVALTFNEYGDFDYGDEDEDSDGVDYDDDDDGDEPHITKVKSKFEMLKSLVDYLIESMTNVSFVYESLIHHHFEEQASLTQYLKETAPEFKTADIIKWCSAERNEVKRAIITSPLEDRSTLHLVPSQYGPEYKKKKQKSLISVNILPQKLLAPTPRVNGINSDYHKPHLTWHPGDWMIHVLPGFGPMRATVWHTLCGDSAVQSSELYQDVLQSYFNVFNGSDHHLICESTY